MKIRSGFVSNSSSSSFIIVGKKGNWINDIDDFFNYIEQHPEEYILVISSVIKFSDGNNVFIPNKKQKKWILDNKEKIRRVEYNLIAVVDPSYKEEDGDYININSNIPLKDLYIKCVDRSYHSFDSKTTSDDMEDFWYEN